MTFPVLVDATWVDSSTVALTADELRRADSGLFMGLGSNVSLKARGGILPHADNTLQVTVDGSDVVTVQSGPAVLPGLTASTGCYRTALAGAASGPLSARNATNGRIDLVVFQQLDTDVLASNPGYTAQVAIIPGAPAATPAVPALPSMAIELGRINVPAVGGGSASVDLSHRQYTCANGGTLPVTSVSTLPLYGVTGQQAIALDTLIRYKFTGSAWVAIDDHFTQSGTKTVTIDSDTNVHSASVTFPVAFGGTPTVVACTAGGSPSFYGANATGASATGFTAQASKTGPSGATTIDVNWIAFGPR